MNRGLLGIIAAINIFLGAVTIAAPDTEKQQSFGIAFDYDDVIFKPVGKITKLMSFVKVSPSIAFWRAAIKQLRHYGKGSWSTWLLLCKQYNDHKGANYFEYVINSKQVYPATEKLILDLHKNNHKLFRATNVGHTEVTMHTTRLPHIFECFVDGIQVNDAPGNHPIKKPSAEYFKQLKKIMQDHCGTEAILIFIDDKKENILAAEVEGFIGIHCTDPAQLENQLRMVGVTFGMPA